MKSTITVLLTTLCFVGFGQSRLFYPGNKVIEVTGTEYVIASVENSGKLSSQKEKYLLFINTRTGEEKRVDFPADGYIENVESVKIDHLGINKVVVLAKAVDLNKKRGIDWYDPKQIFIISPDGKELVQLTNDDFFAKSWGINQQTGTIIITGDRDTNKNNKYDKDDKSEVLIFDLKTLKSLNKI